MLLNHFYVWLDWFLGATERSARIQLCISGKSAELARLLSRQLHPERA